MGKTIKAKTTKVFVCQNCAKKFSYKCTLKVHQEKCLKKATAVVATVVKTGKLPVQNAVVQPKMDTCSEADVAVPNQTSVLVSLLKQIDTDRTKTLHQFVLEYNRIVVCNPGIGNTIGEASASKVANWTPKLKEEELHVNWSNSNDVLDALEDWESDCELKGLKPTTICNYFRNWLVLCLWKISRNECHLDVYLNIVQRIADLQHKTHVSYTRENCVVLMDPSSMAQLRNQVVRALRVYQQSVIYPLIKGVLQFRSQTDTKKIDEFGMDLRCWLELSMRFAESVPSRVQNTEYLVLPSCANDVDAKCRLVYDGDCFKRVIIHDKVSKTHQPTELPVGKITSRILLFYIQFCRPQTDSPYVFCSKHGKRWKSCSADVKTFLENKLKIDPLALDSNGRSVHAARHIVLATLSLQIRHKPNRTEILKGMAGLMRHSARTAELHYDPWRPMVEQQTAAEVFSREFGFYREQQQTEFLAETLAPLSPELEQMPFGDPCLQPLSGAVYSTVKRTRDVGVQTGTGTFTSHQLNGPPQCKLCLSDQKLYGPYARQRDKTRFGKYYFMCKQCSQGFKSALFMPLDYVPPNIVDLPSKKPRNLENILKARGERSLTLIETDVARSKC